MKEIILFDLDGTLFNTKQGIVKCVQYALSYYGIEEENIDSLEKFIGPPLHKSFQMFYGFSEEKGVEAAAKYRERYREEGVFECSPYEGLEEMLKTLKDAGKRLGIATSKPEIFANQILEKFGVAQYFEYVTGSLLDNTRSKKTEVIIEALNRFNATDELDKVIMVGDREHDIIGAKETKLQSVGVKYGFAEGDELMEAGADYIVEEVEELTNLLLSL